MFIIFYVKKKKKLKWHSTLEQYFLNKLNSNKKLFKLTKDYNDNVLFSA